MTYAVYFLNFIPTDRKVDTFVHPVEAVVDVTRPRLYRMCHLPVRKSSLL